MERKKDKTKKKETPPKKKEEKKETKGKDVTTAIKKATKVMDNMGQAMAPKQKWTGGRSRFHITLRVELSISLKYWAITPAVSLNFNKGLSTVEFEFLCFGIYFDFIK